jgi:hypothetical protein
MTSPVNTSWPESSLPATISPVSTANLTPRAIPSRCSRSLKPPRRSRSSTAARTAQLDGGAHRADRVVLARHRKSEDRHDRVADEPLEHAAKARHGLAGGVGVGRQDAAHQLGVVALDQRGGVDDVAADHGDRAAHVDALQLGRQLRH